MFKHIVEREGQFIVRKWGIFGFMVWSQRADYWFTFHQDQATRFDSPESARAAYVAHHERKRSKFSAWL